MSSLVFQSDGFGHMCSFPDTLSLITQKQQSPRWMPPH